MSYTFSVYIPHTLDKNVSTIFAQWHGMPSRTLVSDPDGKVMRLSTKEFLELERRMIFKKNTAYDKIIKINAQGDTLYRAGKPNGWLIEQGGYPPLAFGFSQGYLGWALMPEVALDNFKGYVKPCTFENGEPFVRRTYIFCQRDAAALPQVQLFMDMLKKHR